MIESAALRAVEAAIGVAVERARPVSGGSICEAFACELADGRRVFVKTHRRGPAMFACEARGLAWLGEAGALRVPQVVAVSEETEPVGFLVLELLEGARGPGYEEALGRGLAALHRAGAPRFGHVEDNVLATLAQDNTQADDWAEFYARRRLEPLVRAAIDGGAAPASWAGAFERLFGRLPGLRRASRAARPPAR